MTAMNIVHMRVKPGKEQEFVDLHKNLSMKDMPGGIAFSLVKTGERSFIVTGEWDSLAALAAARPTMIQSLDALRPILEDLGGGRGVTEPYSGEVVLSLRP